MIRIGILGDIGSGKTYVAQSFGYPFFNADLEVTKLYKKDKKTFVKLKKVLPKYFHTFPIAKRDVLNAILDKKNNLNKIVKIVHKEIRKKLNIFLKKNHNKKIIILDIPLLLENKINKKKDILIFIESKQVDILKRLKKRNNFNPKLLKKFKSIQMSINYKKKKSHFIIKNNFKKKSVIEGIKYILNEIS
jgi:dephospho-CoA kinase